MNDPVNHPSHYVGHKSGIECIEITEHMGFNLGNAFKYLWRRDSKADAIEDMNKSVWYLKRELHTTRCAPELSALAVYLADEPDGNISEAMRYIMAAHACMRRDDAIIKAIVAIEREITVAEAA